MELLLLLLVHVLVSVVSFIAIMYDGEDAISKAYHDLKKRSS